MGQVDQAEDFCRQVLQKEPDNPDGLNLLAAITNGKGNINEAIELLEKAVLAAPENPQFSDNLGQLYNKTGQSGKAIESYRASLRAAPNFADAHNNLGNALTETKQYEEAVAHYRKALESDPNNARTQYNLGTTLIKQGNITEAAEIFRGVLKLVPDFTDAHNNLGQCLMDQGDIEEAETHLRRALELNPDHASALNNLGNIFYSRVEFDEALELYRRAISIDPGNTEAWNNLGTVLVKRGSYDEAMTCFQEAFKISPENPLTLGNLQSCLLNTCSWNELQKLMPQIEILNRDALKRNEATAERPLMGLTRLPDLEENLKIARSWSEKIARKVAVMGLNFSMENRRMPKPILTIGYLSFDYRDHVVAHLVRQMFALHDRGSFKVIGYSSGPDDGSDYRREIIAGCDDFVDIWNMTHGKAAQRIHDDQVDILIDLTGFTNGPGLEIAALRPAPIQIHYPLGFPGTTGADFFDYIILDSVVVLEKEEKNFSEKALYIPSYYFFISRPTDGFLDSPPRKDASLPENGIVFCSFNKANKIEPLMFHTWMNLLKKTPDSVLWLIDDNSVATKTLKLEASKRKIDPERLVFAERVPKDQHFARLAMADIALDTRIYNGGATTSDALWAGVPVITLRGGHIPSRASSSMLTSLGLLELIAKNLDEYETLALKFANNPQELQRLKGTLAEKVRSSPLFNTENIVLNLEKAYHQVWEDYVNSVEAR